MDSSPALGALVDTLLPAAPCLEGGTPFPSATSVGIGDAISRIVADLAEDDRRGFARLLRTVDSPGMNLLLSGSPVRFSRLDPSRRERYLLGLARSRLAVKRQAFQAIKRLAMAEYFSGPLRGAANPIWGLLHYEPPGPVSPSNDPWSILQPVTVDSPVETSADVVIVGSGAGGGVIADYVTRAGYSAIILEAGDWVAPPAYPRVEREARNSLFFYHGLATTNDGAIGILAGETVGGGTSINWMTCLDPLTEARREWATEAGMTGVDGPDFDRYLTSVARRIRVSTAESSVNANNETLRRGCRALGYREGVDWDVIPRNAVGCADRCGFCTFGCPYGARQSGPATFLGDAMRGGARLYATTRADQLEIEGGRVTGVRATLRSGSTSLPVHVRARAVVVAAGALQTPALLLRSGVRHPGVGLGLRLDPTTALAAEFPEPIRTWEGPHQTIRVHRFQHSDPGAHGPWIEVAPAHPGLGAIAVPWTGAADFRRLLSRTERVATPIVLVRDVGEGSVRLGSDERPRFDYRLTARDRENLIRGVAETARIMHAAGATRLLSLQTPYAEVGTGERPLTDSDVDRWIGEVRRIGIRDNVAALFSAHPMGSARAGSDPRTSAADPRGRVHGVSGLWIGDGSLLPTAPGVNPMVSILATAARTADFLLADLRQSTPS